MTHLVLDKVLNVKELYFCCHGDFWDPQYRDFRINYA